MEGPGGKHAAGALLFGPPARLLYTGEGLNDKRIGNSVLPVEP